MVHTVDYFGMYLCPQGVLEELFTLMKNAISKNAIFGCPKVKWTKLDQK